MKEVEVSGHPVLLLREGGNVRVSIMYNSFMLKILLTVH